MKNAFLLIFVTGSFMLLWAPLIPVGVIWMLTGIYFYGVCVGREEIIKKWDNHVKDIIEATADRTGKTEDAGETAGEYN